MRTASLLQIILCAAFVVLTVSAHADVTVIEDGKARAAIFVTKRAMEPARARKKLSLHDYRIGTTPEAQQVRLRDSVLDLARCLKVMSGAEVEIVQGAPQAGEKRLPILIGELAAKRFGKPTEHAPGDQAFRFTVKPEGIGLAGESDLATSYAIYELLHRLGCRWYIPSEMGEVIPARKTVTLGETDESLRPYTLVRYIWYCDKAYARRTRQGGLYLAAGHALEGYMPKELLKEHPEWRGRDQQGKTHGRRLRWSRPGVAEAIAETIIARLDKAPDKLSISLSPDDGLGYDDTEDRKLDAGDFDPSTQMVSITDRQVWFCNKIINIVEKKHPDVLFGMLAYGASTRPPVRETPHENLVVQIAPITYTRAHPITHDGEPNNKDFRYLVDGWGKVSDRISYYFYGWFLAEPSAPNPFITKWSVNLRYIYDKGSCRLWQPETTANFEGTMQALYMGLRMAWDPTQDPEKIVAEMHRNFYGNAAEEMDAYWRFIDHVWVDTPEYAGCGWGHMRRWKPERMQKARALMNAGLKAAKTPQEQARVKMADENLQLFELFMKLRRDLAEGRWDKIGTEAKAYYKRCGTLSEEYGGQFAFGGVGYLRRSHKSLYAQYFAAFYNRTYQDAQRLAETAIVLTQPPLRKWRYKVDKEKRGEGSGWWKPGLNDGDWKTTDTCVDSWSALGLHNYMGTMWYRREVELADLPKGKKVYLWIGATDGTAKVYVNGEHCPWTSPKGEKKEAAGGYCRPFSFDITSAVRAGKNQVTVKCVRTFINELGSGGILGSPVVVYVEK